MFSLSNLCYWFSDQPTYQLSFGDSIMGHKALYQICLVYKPLSSQKYIIMQWISSGCDRFNLGLNFQKLWGFLAKLFFFLEEKKKNESDILNRHVMCIFCWWSWAKIHYWTNINWFHKRDYNRHFKTTQTRINMTSNQRNHL